MRRILMSLFFAFLAMTCMAQERIYIQTDRSSYLVGDTVWLRAHLVDAATNVPSSSRYYPKNRSRYVYVEIHEVQTDSLVERVMVKRDEEGVFATCLSLPKTLRQGRYVLIAYTLYMLNYPENMLAFREIDVVGGVNEE